MATLRILCQIAFYKLHVQGATSIVLFCVVKKASHTESDVKDTLNRHYIKVIRLLHCLSGLPEAGCQHLETASAGGELRCGGAF